MSSTEDRALMEDRGLMEDRALAILARIARREVSDLKPEQDLVADLAIDSPKALELLCDIEEEYGFEVPDDAVNGLETVADVVAMVRSCKRQVVA